MVLGKDGRTLGGHWRRAGNRWHGVEKKQRGLRDGWYGEGLGRGSEWPTGWAMPSRGKGDRLTSLRMILSIALPIKKVNRQSGRTTSRGDDFESLSKKKNNL